MGKRTRDKTEEEIERKIMRLHRNYNLEKLQNTKWRLNSDRDYDSFHLSSYNYQDEVDLHEYMMGEENLTEYAAVTEGPVMHAVSPPGAEVTLCSEDTVDVPNVTTGQADEEVPIPEEILRVLGQAKQSSETFGKITPEVVSERLGKILIDGLEKEQKESLMKKILIPESFQLANAPNSNEEVASVHNEPAKNRDKRLEKLQNQLGTGIAGLANLMAKILSKDLDKMEVIKHISEVNQVLLDLHHAETLESQETHNSKPG